ncbi:MAG: rod-binding protein [Armatimonadota bacterium]
MQIQTGPISTSSPTASKNDAVTRDDKSLKNACMEFESVLVHQMIKNMRNSVIKSDLFGSSEKEEMFQDMMDEETSKNFSKTGSIGLADVMYRQLIQQNTAKVIDETVDR